MNGYIALHRKLLDSEVFASPELLHIFIYCLLKANHKERFVSVNNGRSTTPVKVERGQFITGRKAMAEALGIPPSTARNRIAKLERLGIISQKQDRHFTLVTVCNYASYQDEKNEGGQAKDKLRTNKGQAKDTNNNDNKEKNDNKNTPEPHPSPNESASIKPNPKPKQAYTHEFDSLWESYGRRGSKKKAFQIWTTLTDEQRHKANKHIPQYIASVSDAKYVKHLERYLNDELFEQYRPEMKSVSIYS